MPMTKFQALIALRELQNDAIELGPSEAVPQSFRLYFRKRIGEILEGLNDEVLEARRRVTAKYRNAFVSFLSTGATTASAVIRVETSNDGRRHSPRDLSDRFGYEGAALGKEQQDAEAKAWLSAAANL